MRASVKSEESKTPRAPVLAVRDIVGEGTRTTRRDQSQCRKPDESRSMTSRGAKGVDDGFADDIRRLT